MKPNPTHHLLAALLGVVFTAELHAATLDPLDFTSLGTFDVTNGAYVIDTDALTISETNTSSTNILFTGVIDDQDGQADSFGPGGAVTNVGPLGIPHIAVFTFDNLVLDGTATFAVTGHRALALLSRGDALVNVSLSLNAEYSSAGTNIVPGTGGPGGFDGGAPTLDGEGPGSGAGALSSSFTGVYGGAGGFGGAGRPGQNGTPFGNGGPAYGDLFQVLQGGSGGGGARNTLSGTSDGVGGGGGGALELGAANVLTIGASGALRANGGFGQGGYNPRLALGGDGSGGGIRLQATRLILNGAVEARSMADTYAAGGGRLLRVGDAALPVFTVGSLPAVSSYTNGIDVSSSYYSGWITAVPTRTLVPTGTAFELGAITILQTNGYQQTGVELVAGDLTVEGSVNVPAGGITNYHTIELALGSATVTGAGPLVIGKRGILSGQGTVQVDVINAEGGNIIAINKFLTFTGSVSNQLGGEINVVSGTLTVPGDGNGATDDGIINLGAINLINAVINGDVHSPSNSVVNVAGTAMFNGLFKGGASFSGTQNLVTFNGGYSPGDSPAAVNFGGSVTLGAANTLTMELAGTNAGAQYDQVNVSATATLGGTLEVVLLNGFEPAAGDVFHLINASTALGSFATVNLPALPAGLEWQNNVNTDGTLAVIAPSGSGPQFSSVVLSGSGLIFSGTGGTTNGSYVVLTSTNVAAPLINWVPVSTNPFDANGNFLSTNPINPSQPQEFYRLIEPQ